MYENPLPRIFSAGDSCLYGPCALILNCFVISAVHCSIIDGYTHEYINQLIHYDSLQQIQSLSSLIAHSQNSKKEKTAAPQYRMSSLHNWFFCRPPTRSSIWSKTILLHRYRVFQLPANIPAQGPASISDFRCQLHQRDDALCPFSLYAFPVKKSTKRVKKELSTCVVSIL